MARMAKPLTEIRAEREARIRAEARAEALREAAGVARAQIERERGLIRDGAVPRDLGLVTIFTTREIESAILALISQDPPRTTAEADHG